MQARSYALTNGSPLLIREAAPEDASKVLEYIQDVSAETDYLTFGPGEFQLTAPEESEYLRGCRTADNQIYLLALVESSIVGSLNFAAGRWSRVRHSGELGLSVRKEYWGQGVGSALLDTLMDWARRSGVVRKLNLRVRTDNERAIRLYERKGFVREGTIHSELFVGGRYHDLYWMGLVLQ